MRIVLLTMVTMVAFAANSILCRLALGEATIDAASFTTLRLASGAIMLLAVSRCGLPRPRCRGQRQLALSRRAVRLRDCVFVRLN